MRTPLAVILAGPNGSGKTTLKESLINSEFGYTPKLFINADEIKLELNCTNEEAQEIAFERINSAIQEKESFMFETVFSHQSKLDLMETLIDNGYKIKTIFVTTLDPNINIDRVSKRVANGGHDVEESKIRERYKRSMNYIPDILRLSTKFYLILNNNMDGLCIEPLRKRLYNGPTLVFKKTLDRMDKNNPFIYKHLNYRSFVDKYVYRGIKDNYNLQ